MHCFLYAYLCFQIVNYSSFGLHVDFFLFHLHLVLSFPHLPLLYILQSSIVHFLIPSISCHMHLSSYLHNFALTKLHFPVGDSVGLVVGFWDGDIVGDSVGGEGDCVGDFVGDIVGD